VLVRAERRYFSSPTATATQEHTASSGSPGMDVHQGVGRKVPGRGEISEPAHDRDGLARAPVSSGDRENNRIQIFDQDGRYLDEWRQFGRPSGIFIHQGRHRLREPTPSPVATTGAHELAGIRKGMAASAVPKTEGHRISSKTRNRPHPITAGARRASAVDARGTCTAPSSAARCSSAT